MLVAMSGGVDSAAAAAILQQQGYECLGVTLRLVPDYPGASPFEPCCGLEAAEDARRVCEGLGIPHQILHAVDYFDEEIVANFIAEYQRGRTPNPCIRCNLRIKFGRLYELADSLGAEYVAMGHYAQLEHYQGRWALRRAVSRSKDQSYVLAPLSQEQLRRAVFPLGGMTKEESRAAVRHIDYVSSAKRESQEICFVPGRDYGGFIEKRLGRAAIPGPIVNTQGEVLGQHKGLIHYTIGQRRGLGIGASGPYYVLRLDIAKNTLVAGHRDETFLSRFATGPIRWGAIPPQETPLEAQVQLHSRHQAVPGVLEPMGEGGRIRLLKPQSSITPGQWAVCYVDDRVAASAIVERVEEDAE